MNNRVTAFLRQKLTSINLFLRDVIARNSTYWSWGLILLIIIFVFLIRIRLLAIPLERDEGEYAYAAQLMLQGKPLYLSCYNYKLPGIYAAYALILALFGQTISAIHFGLLIINVSTIIMLFLIGRKLLGPSVGLMAGGFFGFLSLGQSVLGFSANWEQFVLLPALAGIFLLLKGIESDRGGSFLGSGLLLGLSLLMRQHGAAFIGFASLYFIIHQAMNQKISWRRFCHQFTLLSLGVIIPFVFSGLVIWLDGTFARFWFLNFTYARKYLIALPFPVGFNNFVVQMARIVASAPLIWLLAVVGIASMFWDKLVKNKRIFLILFAVFSFLAICPGNYFREHYFILVLPAVALLSSVGVFSIARLVPSVNSDKLVIGTPLLLFIIILGHSIFDQRQYLFQFDPLKISRVTYGPNPFIESLQIADYIKKNSTKEDRVVIMGSEPQINFYSNRRSSTGYVFVDQLMQNQSYALPMQQELIKEVETNPPEYIVSVNVPASWCLNPGSEKLILRWLNDYLKYYRLVGLVEIGEVTKYYWDEKYFPNKLQSIYWCAVFKRN